MGIPPCPEVGQEGTHKFHAHKPFCCRGCNFTYSYDGAGQGTKSDNVWISYSSAFLEHWCSRRTFNHSFFAFEWVCCFLWGMANWDELVWWVGGFQQIQQRLNDMGRDKFHQGKSNSVPSVFAWHGMECPFRLMGARENTFLFVCRLFSSFRSLQQLLVSKQAFCSSFCLRAVYCMVLVGE
ncbi:hypothetical protein VTL71DRAFT_16099 [Oculimacula yallundae]|uniref:Uncharacterized protein n=1 Tax=Oculimacula yallundae TaxID=86028 RepID=A0ABR4CEV0_9HELO